MAPFQLVLIVFSFLISILSVVFLSTSASSTHISHSSQSQSQSQVISVGSQIDTNHPIVISDQFSRDGRGSQFGFSVVLIPPVGDSDKSSIIIGAPASNTSDRDYKQRQIMEPGVIWRCTIGTIGQNLDPSCRILFVDPLNPNIGKADCRPNACPAERHDGSGLGFSLAVNSDRLVTCAPRWQRQVGVITGSNPPEPAFKLNGLCYWLPLSIALSDPFSIASMISSGFRSQRLFPLLDKSMQVRENYPIWAWGQTGFSAHLTPSPENELFLGAPGLNGWNGTIIRYQDAEELDLAGRNISSTVEDSSIYSRARIRPNTNGKAQFAEFSLLQTDFIQFYLHFEYLGYAISSGAYLHEGHTLVAASAPRGGRLRGLVMVFEYPTEETPYWYPIQVLQGTGFGSFFGYALESVDVNGDGLEELLVGAPWAGSQGEGCVYVYSAESASAGSGKQPRPKFGRPATICGGDESNIDGDIEPGARFGSTIAGLGDVNGDGVNDFAVGAPGEGADSSGAVYVYFGWSVVSPSGGEHGYEGSESGARVLKPGIKLTPSILGLRGLRDEGGRGRSQVIGFGGSIFGGGVDMDGNGTPDFVVGAHRSQQIILVRNRPRLNFVGHIDAFSDQPGAGTGGASEPNSEPFLTVLPIHASHFIIRSCARVQKPTGNRKLAAQPTPDSKYDVQVTLNVDGELGRFTILAPVDRPETHDLEFDRPVDNTGGTVSYQVTLSVGHDEESGAGNSSLHSECVEWIVHRVDHLNDRDQNPRPVRILQELYYKGQSDTSTSSEAIPAPEVYTIIKNGRGVPELVADSFAEASQQPQPSPFCKFCPPPTRMLTDLHIPLAVDNCDVDGVPSCNSQLHVNIEFQQVDHKFILGTEKQLKALIVVHNAALAETAYFPRVELSWTLALDAVSDGDCDDGDWSCGLGDRLQPNQTRHMELVFPMAEYYAKNRTEVLTLTATVTSVTEPTPGPPLVFPGLRPSLTQPVSTQSHHQSVRIEGTATARLVLEADTHLVLEGSIENATMPKAKDTDTDTDKGTLTKIMHTYTVSLEGSSPVEVVRLSFWFPIQANAGTHSKNGSTAKSDSEVEQLILVGAPEPKGNPNACRMVTPNVTFYVEPVDNSTGVGASAGRGPKSRQIPPYFTANDDEEVYEIEEDESDWILTTKTSSVTQNVTKTSTVTSTSTSTTTTQRTFSSYAEDSRNFLLRTRVTYAMRCLNHDNEEDGMESNCVRVDCIMQRVAPGRRILIRFPLYVKSGPAARALFLNRTVEPPPPKGGDVSTLRASTAVDPIQWRGTERQDASPKASRMIELLPGRVLVQSLGRAQIFRHTRPEKGLDAHVDDENSRFASFVTLLTVKDGDGTPWDTYDPIPAGKLARLPMAWLYLISAVVGLALLLALIYCLVKCGFFHRRRAPPSPPQWRALNAGDDKETVG